MKDIYSHYGLSFDVLSVKIFVVVIEFLVGKGNKLKKKPTSHPIRGENP